MLQIPLAYNAIAYACGTYVILILYNYANNIHVYCYGRARHNFWNLLTLKGQLADVELARIKDVVAQ